MSLVSLVGAGPGHPGLLTLRAVECLARADLVLYDQLVPARLLTFAPANAERICVAQLAPTHAERYQPIQQTMIDAARQGRRVVRLKGGDPFLFGHGGEEAEALRQAGIPFEIVPGITAAFGAAAYAGIPLTHRNHASAVALVTGHEDPEKPESVIDWQSLARFSGTLALYMSMSRLAQNVHSLIQHGKDPQTPAALVHRATTGEQRVVEAPLAELPQAAHLAGITPPVVVFIGEVVSLRSEISWFERLPLFGKRVLVTRPRHQADELVHRLEQLGAVAMLLPALQIREPADWSPVDRALANLDEYHWLVFTSANGVQAFVRRLRSGGRDLRALGHLRLAAIGEQTAAALRSYHFEPDLIPAAFRSENLAAQLRDHVVGKKVLLARADRGRDVLRQELEGVAQVEQVAVYSQVDVRAADPVVLERLGRGEIDFVTVTSSNIARALWALLDSASREQILGGRVKLISISPVTSATLREMGLPVAAEAEVFTAAGVVDALVKVQTER
jgi:uroporphyrinogen III methyltransferase/synthase